MKHKHYDLIIAYANGAKIECKDDCGRWSVVSNPSFYAGAEYRIHRPRLQHIIDAWEGGKEIEVRLINSSEWVKCCGKSEAVPPAWDNTSVEFRIAPPTIKVWCALMRAGGRYHPCSTTSAVSAKEWEKLHYFDRWVVDGVEVEVEKTP